MTCTKCGEEIKPGNLYCSKCGMEVQIVSAYNVMEDEFFIDIHKQEMKPVSQRGATDYGMILQKKNLYFCKVFNNIIFNCRFSRRKLYEVVLYIIKERKMNNLYLVYIFNNMIEDTIDSSMNLICKSCKQK